jgi:hypothetical protein
MRRLAVKVFTPANTLTFSPKITSSTYIYFMLQEFLNECENLKAAELPVLTISNLKTTSPAHPAF